MTDPDSHLAEAILDNIRGYAIALVTDDGQVAGWMADAPTITGYDETEALGMPIARIFTSSDQAAGVPEAELREAQSSGLAEDTRWHQKRDGELFWANGLTFPIEDTAFTGLVKVFRDETPGRLADEQRVLLLHELNHRVKNTLATVQAVTEQTLRAANVDPAVRRTLTARLMALSEAHNVLVDQSWAGADLGAVVDQVLAPHRRTPSPFRLEGPPVRLSPPQAIGLSLIVHELTTNAVKYGALSVEGGEVSIAWNLAQDGEGGRHLTLLWRETGGPPVTPPTRAGFGARLIRQSLNQPGAKATLEFPPQGVTCLIETPLAEDVDRPVMNPLESDRTPA